MKNIILNTQKTLLASFLFISASLLAQATYTVNNNTGTSANFTDLQTAINTVAAGSTLYIQQSSTSYGTITLNKSITLIGRSAGESGYKSIVGAINFAIGSSNTTIKGLEISSIGESSTAATLSNITILDNTIPSGISIGNTHTFNNVLIQGNIIGSAIYTYAKATNLLITNNLIFCNTLSFYKTNTLLLSNNVFCYYPGANIYNYGSDLLNISNCIFISNYGAVTTINLSPGSGTIQVNNCITYNYNATYTSVFKTGTGITINANVKLNTNPLFTKVGLVVPGLASPNNASTFDPANDNLKLQAGTPVVDAGIFEGYNFKNFGTTTGYPSFKIVSNSATVPKNGNLSVTIEAQTN